jgi:hypothetical protein
MKKLGLALVMGMAMLAIAIVATMTLPSENTVEAKKQDEAILRFTIGVDTNVSVAEIVDRVRKAAKIGTNDPNGFQVDSFFDIEYRIDFSDERKLVAKEKLNRGTAVVDIEIHAVPNSPDMNPGAIIDAVRAAASNEPHEYIGHVTLIR